MYFIDGFNLEVQCFFQARSCTVEKLFELGVELLLHSLEILDRERQQSRILDGLNRELPYQVKVNGVD